MILPPIYVVGYPGSVGGANTELWHTLKLWRRYGLDVHLIPTSHVGQPWRQRCDALGCETHEVPEGDRDALRAIPGLPGATVISFCNDRFLATASTYRRLGCKTVCVNCMNWLFSAEEHHYRREGPFDAYVFQSRYQQRTLLAKLQRFGVGPSQCHHIPGALDVTEFNFCPRRHRPQDEFFLGRISRADPDKFHRNTWLIIEAVPYARRRARILGWSESVEDKLGRPPSWAEAMPCGDETPQAFYGSLHCLLHITGSSRENWPRCGLEAMAAGVPIIAEADFGWPEMIEHGVSGLLAGSADEFAYYAARLAYEEEYRLEMALAARRRVCEVLASPQRNWERWCRLLESL
jgi:glycosyltransferase involved in cell wall biosynthesis